MDALEGLKQIQDKSINHIVTSPPYNRKRNDKYELYDDTKDEYYEWLCEIIQQCIRVTKGYVFFNIQKNYYNKVDVFKIIGNFANNIQEIIIWEKTNPMPASGSAITNSYEFFLVFSKIKLKSNSTYTKNIISTAVNGNMPVFHKAVMKQDVCDWIIKKFTNKNDLILDCFMGTGTTAISCKRLSRNYVGFELIQRYVDIANKRLAQDVLLSHDTPQPTPKDI